MMINKVVVYASIFSIITHLSPVSSTAEAAEYIEPIAFDRLLIDGSVSDWQHIRRYSAEYLLKGVTAQLDDFQGGLRFAYNHKWLYLAIDCVDSDLIQGQRGDSVQFILQGMKHTERLTLDFFLKGGRNKRSSSSLGQKIDVLSRINGRLAKDIEVEFSLNQPSGYFIEVRLPMSMVSWVYGESAILSATFNDVDDNGADSIYTTHLISSPNKKDIGYVFGGAQVYKDMYTLQESNYKVIVELSHDWVGDQREELLMITDAEIVLFGGKISKESGISRYVHGWKHPNQIKARIDVKRGKSTLVISHQDPQGNLSSTEHFQFIDGSLHCIK